MDVPILGLHSVAFVGILNSIAEWISRARQLPGERAARLCGVGIDDGVSVKQRARGIRVSVETQLINNAAAHLPVVIARVNVVLDTSKYAFGPGTIACYLW